jgi:hypothetical protein
VSITVATPPRGRKSAAAAGQFPDSLLPDAVCFFASGLITILRTSQTPFGGHHFDCGVG